VNAGTKTESRKIPNIDLDKHKLNTPCRYSKRTTMKHQTAIEASNLSKDYGHRAVLRHVDFQASEGQIIALRGANGAGKTTLLRCLASLVRPTAGQIRWFGLPAEANLAARRLIGVVTHESRLYPHLTLRENLMFAARMYGVSDPGRQADRMLDCVGLLSHSGRLPSQVSKGMRHRVAIARALLHGPRVLLLDEPFSSLDVGGCQWLARTMSQWRAAGHTICFATHDPTKADQLADAAFELRSGRMHRLPINQAREAVENEAATNAAAANQIISTRNQAA
jgi:heme ABC exporter ATP-binding subunit CcmA